MHVAVMKYVQSKEVAAPAAAMVYLFDEDIEANVEAAAKLDPNQDTRTAGRFYCEAVDSVLRTHEQSLRAVFDAYAMTAAATHGHVTAKLEAKLMSVDEWMKFVGECGVADSDLSARDARMCFMRARMKCVDEESVKGKVKASQLSFEDFLEALCQAALLKALPTDEEIAAAGEEQEEAFLDGGDYLIWLHDYCPADHAQLLHERAGEWGEAPRQPVERCVDHLVTLVIRTIKQSAAVASEDETDMELATAEVRRFLKGDKTRMTQPEDG